MLKGGNRLLKLFAYLLGVYFLLIIIFQWSALQQAHNVYYSAVAPKFFNAMNPNLYVVFFPEAPPNEDGWNTTIHLYKKEKHNVSLSNKAYRSKVSMDSILYRNFYELALLPTLFLIALFVVTPLISWKKKLLYFTLSLIILYIFLSFHYSHIIENLTINQGIVGSTLWHKFINIFSFRGLTEPIYIIAMVAWASFCFRPQLLDYISDNYEEKSAPVES